MTTNDVAHWTCPDCGYEVESEAVVDPTFAERIEEHESYHVERRIVIEVAPYVLDRLREMADTERALDSGANVAQASEEAESLAYVTEKISEGFHSSAHIVILTESTIERLVEMAETLALEGRTIYAERLSEIIEQAKTREVAS